MSLRANVIAAVITATAALILTILLLEDPLVEYRLTSRVRDDLLEAARSAARSVERGHPPDEAADQVGAAWGCRLTIVGPDGEVVGDTGLDGEALAALRPERTAELAQAQATGQGFAIERDERSGRVVLRAAIRGPSGHLFRASRPVATIEAARAITRELLIVGGIVAAIASALLTLALSRTLVRPVEELTRAADALARGDLTVRTRSTRADELGRVGRSLDQMADLLEERMGAARSEEARLEAVLDAMVEGVFVTDRKGVITLTNQALDRMTSTPGRGKHVLELIGSQELLGAVKSALRGEPAWVEVELHAGDEERFLAVGVAPIQDETGSVAVLHDVTDLKQTDRVRRDFVANASHELRTPLTAIRGFAETLRSGAASDPETANRFLDTILRHTTRLQRLVDDLLVLSRSESEDQEFELGPIDVAEIARHVVASLESQARAKEIEVLVEGLEALPMASANAWAMDHVLVNLVDNAVKYTQAGGRVTLRGSHDATHVVLEVRDTGPGLTPGQVARIFERFYRVDSGRARDQGGTGLGLSIVKHLVQRLEATIDVESEPGRGTTFRVVLPRAGLRGPEAAAPSEIA